MAQLAASGVPDGVSKQRQELASRCDGAGKNSAIIARNARKKAEREAWLERVRRTPWRHLKLSDAQRSFILDCVRRNSQWSENGGLQKIHAAYQEVFNSADGIDYVEVLLFKGRQKIDSSRVSADFGPAPDRQRLIRAVSHSRTHNGRGYPRS